MKQNTLLLYRGAFGSRAAQFAANFCAGARLIDLDIEAPEPPIDRNRGGKAVVFLSTATDVVIDGLAARLRAVGMTWTCVRVYPAMLRIGPKICAEGICYACANRRYLSNPGSSGLARLEEFLRSDVSVSSTEFPGVIATTVAIAATEALRQLHDDGVQAGYIRKADLLDHSMQAAVAVPLHACPCAGAEDEGDEPGERFYRALSAELQGIAGRSAS